jgi:hypothetical protein
MALNTKGENIQKIKLAPGSFSVNLCYAGVIIYLDDRKKIWINGRVFTKAEEKPHLTAFFIKIPTRNLAAF